jgi:hypothetical protein
MFCPWFFPGRDACLDLDETLFLPFPWMTAIQFLVCDKGGTHCRLECLKVGKELKSKFDSWSTFKFRY